MWGRGGVYSGVTVLRDTPTRTRPDSHVRYVCQFVLLLDVELPLYKQKKQKKTKKKQPPPPKKKRKKKEEDEEEGEMIQKDTHRYTHTRARNEIIEQLS